MYVRIVTSHLCSQIYIYIVLIVTMHVCSQIIKIYGTIYQKNHGFYIYIQYIKKPTLLSTHYSFFIINEKIVFLLHAKNIVLFT